MNHGLHGPAKSLLALDFGFRRIGVATGSCLTGTASRLETVTAIAGEPNWGRIDQLIKEWAPDLIVLGLPYNRDGSESDMTGAVKDFAATLQSRYQLPVEFIDERYTSVEAESLLREQRRQGIRNKKLKKEDVDAVAAQLIAESWLNTARPD
mgnify:CR=1 FL=1